MNKAIIWGVASFFVLFLLIIFYKMGLLNKTIFIVFLVFVGVILLIFLVTYLVAVKRDINKDTQDGAKKSLEYVFKKINEELGAMAGGDVLSWNEGLDCKVSRRYFQDNNGKTHDIVCIQSPMSKNRGDNLSYYDVTEDKLVEFISEASADRLTDPWQKFNIVSGVSNGGQSSGMFRRGHRPNRYGYQRPYPQSGYPQGGYPQQSGGDDQFVDDITENM